MNAAEPVLFEPPRNPLASYRLLLEQSGCDRDLLRPEPQSTAGKPGKSVVSLANILVHPERFRLLLQGAAARQGTDTRTLASVLHQNLALQVIGPLVVDLFLDHQTTLAQPASIWLELGDSSGQWHFERSGDLVGEKVFTERTAAQARDWYRTFRKDLGVSAGAYWSSTGLAFCAPYSALYNLAPPDALCRQATDWLARFDCDAKRFIDWIPFSFNQQACAIPQRRGCCQKYRLPDGAYCGTCGIYRKERLQPR
ncbi:MAG: (2Fe-2S)-binding protein [Marinobacter sp.]|uniref:(2Fe-2S)-binding protein n=1 Tax=Marinobacter sp. TaxID=50741 RepID=UPI00299D4300|nr:(2Fe-2S)-binding protein [Marinobacter sp.]MDX1754569.1 (2Fe-2S)-binding protein [Marinobacter sp.]